MEGLVPGVGAKLLEYGIGGIFLLVVLALAWVQRKELQTANEKLYASNEARIGEAKELSRALAENTVVLSQVALSQEKAADASKSLVFVIEGMDKTMEKVEAALDRGHK